MDVSVKDADIRDVITFLARHMHVNVVMTEAVQGRVTMFLEDVPVRTALDAVLKVKGFDSVTSDNVVMVMTRDEMDRYLERRRWR